MNIEHCRVQMVATTPAMAALKGRWREIHPPLHPLLIPSFLGSKLGSVQSGRLRKFHREIQKYQFI
jgi:hypothetical protein